MLSKTSDSRQQINIQLLRGITSLTIFLLVGMIIITIVQLKKQMIRKVSTEHLEFWY